MARRVFRYEHDGKELFAVRSSISDSFITLDMTRDELVEWWGEEARRRGVDEIGRELGAMDRKEARNFVSNNLDKMREDIKKHLEVGNVDDKEFNNRLKELLKQHGQE